MGEYSYYLMHKDIPITMLSFSESGDIISCAKKTINDEHLPIACLNKDYGIPQWWNDRTIPKTRDNLKKMLETKGFSVPKNYLFNNLGLSLTDCYWIKPIDSELMWEDVNLFSNPFKDDSLKFHQNENNSQEYSPNSSLLGNIEKTWAIKDNGRFLIKGNRTKKSAESINEVFASSIHRLQGHNCAKYDLIHIQGKPYQYGCITPIFTSEKTELISAYDLLLSNQSSGDYYNSLVSICESVGMDKDKIVADIDYLILTDYIMSQTDRHFNNIGFLRNADTLKFSGMAPIYDSGNSMYFNSIAPRNEHDLLYLSTKGFVNELELSLRLVKDASSVDLTKLPPASDIEKIYEKDTEESEEHIHDICYAYERRIDRCRNFQLGISPNKPIYIQIPPESKDVINFFTEDHAFISLLNRCQEQYRYLSIQQKKGLKDLAAKTKTNAEATLSQIILLFEKKGFSEDDFYKYVEAMGIPDIPNQCEKLISCSDKKPTGDGDDAIGTDDWTGLDEP